MSSRVLDTSQVTAAVRPLHLEDKALIQGSGSLGLMLTRVLSGKLGLGARRGEQPRTQRAGGREEDASSRALKNRALTPNSQNKQPAASPLSPGQVRGSDGPFKSSSLGLCSTWRVRGAACGISLTRAPLGGAGPEVTECLGFKGCCRPGGKSAGAGTGGGVASALTRQHRQQSSVAAGQCRRMPKQGPGHGDT